MITGAAPRLWLWIAVVVLAVVLFIVLPFRQVWYYSDASGRERGQAHGPYASYLVCQDVADRKTTSMLRRSVLRQYECASHLEWQRDALDETTLVVVTLFLAAFTASLFAATRDVATDTLRASQLADLHHQEILRPIVVWEMRVEFHTKHPDRPTESCPSLLLLGALRNIGGGPAIAIRLTELEVQPFVPLAAHGPQELGHLGSGMVLERAKVVLTVPNNVYGQDVFKPPFKLTLSYENQFGQPFKTHMSCAGGESPVKTMFEFPVPVDRVGAVWGDPSLMSRVKINLEKQASAQESAPQAPPSSR